MSDSMQERLKRVRESAKVELYYENPNIESPVQHHSLPFVIGVLANLSGHKANRVGLRERRWLSIDRDDFSERMAKIEPSLTLTAEGLGEFTVRFRNLDDFGPAQVAAQVPALTDLIHARRRLGQFAGEQSDLDRLLSDLTGRSAILRSVADQLRPAQPSAPAAPPPPPASGAALLDDIIGGMAPVEVGSGVSDTIDQIIRHAAMAVPSASREVEKTVATWLSALDQRLGNGVRAVLHHADFRALEGTWRGLWYLVRNTETSPSLIIQIFDVNQAELSRDLAGATSTVFEKTAIQPIRDGGHPFGLFLGDYEFGPGEVSLLQRLARMGQTAHAPFVAAAAPGLLGLRSASEIPDVEDLESRAKSDNLADWRAFRSTPESRYAVMIVPRVMARRPYGKQHTEVEEFSFEELAGGTATERCCWMSAAWCFAQIVGDAFARDGWFMRTAGVESGGKIEGVPSYAIERDDEQVMIGPAEVEISGRDAETLAGLGFVPVLPVRGSDAAVFPNAHSCRKTTDEADAVLGEVRHLLGVSRFAQSLLTIAHVHTSANAEELGGILNEWLSHFTASDPDNWVPARQPLLGGMVKVKPVPNKSGAYRIAAALVLPVSETAAPTLPLNVGTVPMS